MIADLINGCFEFFGAFFIWGNVVRTWKDKGYAGVYLPACVFFTTWGIWNLYYYPSLGQWWSFAGGLAIVLMNALWVGLMFYFGRKR